MTHREEEQDILNPLVMHAAMQLWFMIRKDNKSITLFRSIVQAMTVQDGPSRRINYPSICVKFPMPPEFGRAIHALFAPNMTT